MKTLSLLCTMLLTATFAIAQKSPFTFGHVPLSELKMTRYEKDTTADAVYLFRYETTSVTWASSGGYSSWPNQPQSFQTVTKRHERLKILKANGVVHGTIMIPIFDNLIDVKAVTYNLEDGKVVETPLKDEGKFNEQVVRGFRVYKIVLPNVRVGSVLDLMVSIAQSSVTDAEFRLQTTIPVLHAEFWAIFPEEFEFAKYMQGYVQATKFETKDLASEFKSAVVGYHWIVKDVPAFRAEPYMTEKESLISKVNLSFKGFRQQLPEGGWEDISKRLATSHDFAGLISSSFFVQSKARELVMGLNGTEDKIAAIHKYVRETFTCNEWDNHFPSVRDLKKVWDDRKGSSLDINLLLACLLDKIGLNPKIVVLRTRELGVIRKEDPTAEQFNHVICSLKIDGRDIFLDATEKNLPPDLLPSRCLADEGLLISETNPAWIPISSPRKSIEQASVEMNMDDKRQMVGKIDFLLDGYYALRMRSAYDSSADGRWKNYLESKHSGHSTKIETKNLTDVMKPTGLSFDVTYSQEPWGKDVVYLNPYVALRMTVNPFQPERRIYPVDMEHPFDRKYYIKITIPDGYYPESIPSSAILRLADNSAKFTYNTNVSNNMITVTSVFTIAKSTFSQAEYPHLREFYNQVVAKQAEMIVLRRK